MFPFQYRCNKADCKIRKYKATMTTMETGEWWVPPVKNIECKNGCGGDFFIVFLPKLLQFQGALPHMNSIKLFWYLYGLRGQSYLTLHKKWSFPLRISSVIVIKFPADLVTFTEETLNGKLYFLWSVKSEPAISLLFFEMLVKN